MISPEMKVQWMNVKEEQVKTTSILDLFKEHSHRSTKMNDGHEEIRFNPGELKVTDWRGWTDIEYIRRIEDMNVLWVALCTDSHDIIVSSEELIPVYKLSIPRRGFHGASIFEYQLKIPRDIDKTTDFIRIRRGFNQEEFVHIYEPIYDCTSAPSLFGYEIGTRSKFFNCNNIHIFGSDSIPDKMEVSR